MILKMNKYIIDYGKECNDNLLDGSDTGTECPTSERGVSQWQHPFQGQGCSDLFHNPLDQAIDKTISLNGKAYTLNMKAKSLCTLVSSR